MTIVAYKDGVLASDTAVWCGQIWTGDTKKIIKTHEGVLCGTSGDTITCQKFRRWIVNGGEAWKSDEESFSAMVIAPDGTISLFHGKKEDACQIDAAFHAIGYGQEIALGAMAAGASAREAVAIAIERHAYCGGSVNYEELDAVTT